MLIFLMETCLELWSYLCVFITDICSYGSLYVIMSHSSCSLWYFWLLFSCLVIFMNVMFVYFTSVASNLKREKETYKCQWSFNQMASPPSDEVVQVELMGFKHTFHNSCLRDKTDCYEWKKHVIIDYCSV